MKRVEAQTIIFGGDIVTVNEFQEQVEAVAVNNGRIMDMGTYESMLVHKGVETEMIDLKGNTLMPGFVDPHCHYEVAAVFDSLGNISCRACKTSEEVMEKVMHCTDGVEPGKWIALQGYDQLTFPDLPNLDRKFLDRISTEHAIFITTFTFHEAFVNSKALEYIGLTKESKNPQGGAYGHDQSGELNGIIIEIPAIAPFLFTFLKQEQFDFEEAIVKKANFYAKNGITTSFGPGVFEFFPDTMGTIRKVVSREDSPVRSGFLIMYEQVEAGMVKLEDFPKEDNQCWCTGVKFFYDGAPYSATMLVKEPYIKSKMIEKLNMCDCNGKRVHQFEEYKELIKKYHEKGCQIMVHCQGDLAAREVLDAFEYAMDSNPRYDLRHRIEHCMLVSKEDIVRAKKLGVSLSMHANHIRYYGEALCNSFIGKKRGEHIFACRTAIDAGHRISLHCDDPMFPGLPLSVLETVITRKTDRGVVIGGDEAINVEEAIRAVTIDAAYQCHVDNKVGSIDIGKFADFVVLAENPHKIDPQNIANITILATYKDGKKVKHMVK